MPREELQFVMGLVSTAPSVAQASRELRGLRGRVMSVERECAKSTRPVPVTSSAHRWRRQAWHAGLALDLDGVEDSGEGNVGSDEHDQFDELWFVEMFG